MTSASATPSGPAQLPPPRRKTSCCASGGSCHGVFSVASHGGDEHSLRVDGDRLVLGEHRWATVIALTAGDAGTVTAWVPGGRRLTVADSEVRVGDTGATPLVIEVVDGQPEHLRLRTENGQYLRATEPGAPIALTADAHAGSVFRFAHRDQFEPRWAADADHPWEESHSTHLWIFKRAMEAIFQRGHLGAGVEMSSTYDESDRIALKWCLGDTDFKVAVEQGIYDADNTGVMDKDTSGVIYSAHFWNPETGTGGTWDPNPKINAFNYGTRYFRESLQDEHAKSSGRKLGLAIHYLQDVTQPMHCGLFRNNPVPPIDYRHENYEQWALRRQDAWKLDAQDLDRLDMTILRADEAGHPQWTKYWSIAAKAALAEYNTWRGVANSPIGALAPMPKGAKAPPFADELWTPVASKMLKLAQRLVINLLLSWASLSRFAATQRGTAAPDDEVLAVANVESAVVGSSRRPGERADLVYYRYPLAVGSREAWALEQVVEGGAPVRDGANAVYHLRNRHTGICVVASDRYDGKVYLQDPSGRLNAQWTLEPTGTPVGPDPSGVHEAFRLRDRKHKKYLFADTSASLPLLLQHRDDGSEWMRIPAASFWIDPPYNLL